MANINRIRVALTGFPGAPGVSTYFCNEPATFVPLLRAFYLSLAASFPTNFHATVEAQGDIIDDVSGILQGTFDVPTVPEVVGLSPSPYAGPAGLSIQWNTLTINDGSRIRGRTFMVPLSTEAYQADGSIVGSTLAGFQGAAATLLDTSPGNMVVWRRPREARAATANSPALTARAGTSAVVTSSTVHDTVAVLRSRRG